MINLSIPEPDPIPNRNPSIHDLVIEDILKRKAVGLKEYKVLLQAGNTRNPQQDRYDELLDAICYLKQEMEENKLFEINSLVVQKPIGTQGVFVEALHFCDSNGVLCKQWRIKIGDYFYGKDKRKACNWGNDQFTDNYCWNNMKEAFLFAKENLIGDNQ